MILKFSHVPYKDLPRLQSIVCTCVSSCSSLRHSFCFNIAQLVGIKSINISVAASKTKITYLILVCNFVNVKKKIIKETLDQHFKVQSFKLVLVKNSHSFF